MKENFNLQVPRFENPFANNDSLTDLERYISVKLRDDGFCVFDFPVSHFETLSDNLVSNLTAYFKKERHNEQFSSGQRLQDALYIEEVRQIAGNAEIINILNNVYGRRPFPFQTLNFPSGTQQDAHSDHVHFDSIPHRFMAGVWLALEDIDDENGPLFYYPGSHKWPALSNVEIGHHQYGEAAPHYNRFPESWNAYANFYGVKKECFYAKKGQCLIWTSNLVHGGSRQLDINRTRWSQVTHYFFDDCAYYTPLLSTPHAGVYSWREIYDLISGEFKPNKVNGFKIDDDISGRISLDPLWFNSVRYLELNPDVEASGINPYQHYVEFGVREGRRTK